MWSLLWLACASAPDATAVLAKADAHDGTADHVVGECSGCGLGMPGDPNHAATHEGYTLHFCSDSCKSAFEKDPAAGVARLAEVVK